MRLLDLRALRIDNRPNSNGQILVGSVAVRAQNPILSALRLHQNAACRLCEVTMAFSWIHPP